MASPRDAFWARVHRRADGLTPAQRAAFLAAIEGLKGDLSTREVEGLVARGNIEEAVALALSDQNVNRAFSRFRARQQLTTRDAVGYFGRDIPGVPRGTTGVSFNVLNPRVIDAVKQMDTVQMGKLTTDIRETVRTVIRKGLEDGAGPRTTARALRDVLGLAPNQLAASENYEKALKGVDGAGSPLTRALRDRRYDGPTRRGTLTADQIEKATAAYRRRMIAFNAETHARTATLDALKLGQELSWRDAIDKGYVTGQLMKQWKTVGDDRVRPDHVAMEGETVPFESVYSNGEMVPGESTYNCRCLSIVFAQRE